MNQKKLANIILIVVIVSLGGTLGYFTLPKSWPSISLPEKNPSIIKDSPQIIQPASLTPAGSINAASNIFSTNIDGYFETCMDNESIYKRLNNSWQRISNELPSKGLYYLDDKFIGYGMCDVVACIEVPKPYTVPLAEYEKMGEKIPPPESGSTATTLPVYRANSLGGEIKIEIKYFSDKNCQENKIFSMVVNR